MAGITEEKRHHILVVDNTDVKLNELARKRCFEAIKESGTNVDSMEPVTREEALKHVADAFGWQDFIEKGGLEWHYYEGSLKNRKNELIGIAVVGPRNPINPRKGKVGAIGIKGGFISLGHF